MSVPFRACIGMTPVSQLRAAAAERCMRRRERLRCSFEGLRNVTPLLIASLFPGLHSKCYLGTSRQVLSNTYPPRDGRIQEAIATSESEWSQNKKLIDFSHRPGDVVWSFSLGLNYFCMVNVESHIKTTSGMSNAGRD